MRPSTTTAARGSPGHFDSIKKHAYKPNEQTAAEAAPTSSGKKFLVGSGRRASEKHANSPLKKSLVIKTETPRRSF